MYRSTRVGRGRDGINVMNKIFGSQRSAEIGLGHENSGKIWTGYTGLFCNSA